MDNNIINKEKLLFCIKATNRVTQRWITQQNVRPDRILDSEILSIFKGYLKKHLIPYLPDFKRVSKTIRLYSDSNRFITDIKMLVVEEHGYRTQVVASNVYALIGRLNAADFIECRKIDEDAVDNSESNYQQHAIPQEETQVDLKQIELNLEKIKSIKF